MFRREWIVSVVVGAILVSVTGSAQAQSKFPDVPPSHWAYQAVEDLASAGLVLGYPDGRFLGNRTLTRYEMATIVKRIVDNLAQRMSQTPTPTTPMTPAPTPGVTQEQLDALRRLVDEYKAELTVIGTNLSALQTQMQTLQEDVNGLRDVTAGQRLELDTLNLARAQVRVDGYVQARYVRRGTNNSTRAPEGTSTDTSRALNGNVDTFNVRRARINIRGDVSERGAYRIQLDAGSSGGTSAAVGIKEAYVVIKNFGPLSIPGLSNLVGGIGDGKFFTSQDFTLGQQVTPFGYYLQYSSSDREAPERYIGFSDTASGLFPDQDYDKGASINGIVANKIQYQLGIYNGTGITSNDFGRRKDFIGRLGIPLTPNWDLGVSGYDGEGNNIGSNIVANGTVPVAPGAGVPRVLLTRRRVRSLIGVDSQYYFPFGAALKVEYVRGKGGLNGNAANTVTNALKAYVDGATVEAYYIQGSYNLGTNLTLALAYDYFNRNTDPADSGPFSTFGTGAAARRVSSSNFVEERVGGGALYFVDSNTRVRLWYEAPLNFPNPPGGPEGGAGTAVTGRSGQYTAEVQVRF